MLRWKRKRREEKERKMMMTTKIDVEKSLQSKSGRDLMKVVLASLYK